MKDQKLSELYSDLKIKYSRLKLIIKQKDEQIKLLKEQQKSNDDLIYGRLYALEELCISLGHLKGRERIMKQKYYSEKAYKQINNRCEKYRDLYHNLMYEINRKWKLEKL